MNGQSLLCQVRLPFHVPHFFTTKYSRGTILNRICRPLECYSKFLRFSNFFLVRSFKEDYYLFQPYSASAAVPIGFSNVSSSTLYQVTPMSISGYLSGNYSRVYNSSVFTQNGALPPPPFKSGIYTVIAGDEWGQVVLLHFTVRG